MKQDLFKKQLEKVKIVYSIEMRVERNKCRQILVNGHVVKIADPYGNGN